MKYSTTTFLFPAGLAEAFEWVAEAGFDAIDVPGDVERFPAEAVRELSESYPKLALGEITGVWGPDKDLLNPRRDLREHALKYASSCVELAAETGSRLTHACFMTYPENLTGDRERLVARALKALRQLIAEAEDRGVVLMVEPLFKGDVTLVNRVDQALSLWQVALGVDREALDDLPVGLLLDAYHMFNEEDSISKAVESAGKLVKHVHVADENRGTRFAGPPDFLVETFRALERVGFAGLVSLEPIPLDFDPSRELDDVLARLKAVEDVAFARG